MHNVFISFSLTQLKYSREAYKEGRFVLAYSFEGSQFNIGNPINLMASDELQNSQKWSHGDHMVSQEAQTQRKHTFPPHLPDTP